MIADNLWREKCLSELVVESLGSCFISVSLSHKLNYHGCITMPGAFHKTGERLVAESEALSLSNVSLGDFI